MQGIERLVPNSDEVKRIFAAAVFCVLFSSVGFSQLLENKHQHELLVSGIHATLIQQYDSAESCFQTMIREYPAHPAGYLYLAGMIQAKYTDYGNSFNAERYDSLLTKAFQLSERMLKDKKTEAWGYLYTGTAEAFRSFTASENGSLAKGFYYGINAGSSLERCLEADSTFTEAKNILGSYYYWRSKLAWIPFISDRTEEGIALIKQALSHPYEKHLASHNLMLILIDEKRYAEAESIGTAMLQEYPDNRSFMWNLMTVYEQSNNGPKLEEICKRLLKSALRAPVINRYTEATCRLKLANFAVNRGDFQTAADQCTAILRLEKYQGKVKGDLQKKIRRAEELLSKMNKK
jgi:hypothetical protein